MKKSFVDVICNDVDKVVDSFIYHMSLLYGYSSTTIDNDESIKKIIEIVKKEIVKIEKNDNGFHAVLEDIQEGCFLLADEILGNNSYLDQFGCKEESTYNGALKNFFNDNSGIEIKAEIVISSQYSGDFYEKYYTKNNELIMNYAILCDVCGRLFVPEEGFWFNEKFESLEMEENHGICSKECANEFINSVDKYKDFYVANHLEEITEKLKSSSPNKKTNLFDVDALINNLPKIQCDIETLEKINELVLNEVDDYDWLPLETENNDGNYPYVVVLEELKLACAYIAIDDDILKSLRTIGLPRSVNYVDSSMLVFKYDNGKIFTDKIIGAESFIAYTCELIESYIEKEYKIEVQKLYALVNGINNTDSFISNYDSLKDAKVLKVIYENNKILVSF